MEVLVLLFDYPKVSFVMVGEKNEVNLKEDISSIVEGLATTSDIEALLKARGYKTYDKIHVVYLSGVKEIPPFVRTIGKRLIQLPTEGEVKKLGKKVRRKTDD